jgi:hypothetical protein
MGYKLNGTSEIWADGYSFMEVTETLLTAMGTHMDQKQTLQTEAPYVESTLLPNECTQSLGLTEPSRV